jgi:hypothetical protein
MRQKIKISLRRTIKFRLRRKIKFRLRSLMEEMMKIGLNRKQRNR